MEPQRLSSNRLLATRHSEYSVSYSVARIHPSNAISDERYKFLGSDSRELLADALHRFFYVLATVESGDAKIAFARCAKA